jgi:hypothetical protein
MRPRPRYMPSNRSRGADGEQGTMRLSTVHPSSPFLTAGGANSMYRTPLIVTPPRDGRSEVRQCPRQGEWKPMPLRPMDLDSQLLTEGSGSGRPYRISDGD